MKKKVLILALSCVIMSMLAGCSPTGRSPKDGNRTETVPSGTVKYEIMLNTGSCFVYTFQDPATGVWYISTSEGITTRVNSNGTLYKETEQEEQ